MGRINEAKEEIRKLIEKYERVKDTHQILKYSEADTRREFVMPLFKALGWDVYNDSTREVQEEVDAVRGTVDYSFLIGNIPRFVVEAKALRVDLDQIEWAKQAVNYGWNKNIPWVILTDFEGFKVFNSEWKNEIPRSSKEFSYNEYLSRFDELWLFSKELTERGELDKLAAGWGILAKRASVNEKLAKDLIEWRDLLTENLKHWNPQIKDEEIDESVQRVLDRLIFIRTCEDRQIEPPILWPSLQRWLQKGRRPYNFMEELIPVFREFDKIYNSSLFLPHLCEKLETEGDPFEKIIYDLYSDKESGVRYRFDKINADILGAIYEQYLAHVQFKREKNESKRKKQGIYYTPTFIVDYIVENSLKPALDNCKSIKDLKKIKVLDPACGSGSFLIRALEVINKKYKEFGAVGNEYTKINILLENLHGVDIDEQAVEITRLNLLINSLSQRMKLPILKNIRNGNSLISGSEKELRAYFGKGFGDKNPFNWQEEFPEVFKQNKFDVVIGNPPYIQSRNIQDDKERHFLWDKYLTDTNHSDVFSFFIQKGISLLKSGGYLGFIVPITLLTLPSFKSTRKLILENCQINKIVLFPSMKVFKDAFVEPMIIILRKRESETREKIEIVEFVNGEFRMVRTVSQKSLELESNLDIFQSEPESLLVKKLISNSVELNNLCTIVGGIRTGNDIKFLKTNRDKPEDRKLIRGRNFGRYYSRWQDEFIWYRPDLMKVKQAAAPKEPKFFEVPKKILVRMISGRGLIATIDCEKLFLLQDNLILQKTQGLSLEFLLGILNSKLMGFYLKSVSSNIAVTQGILRKLPIYKINLLDKKDVQEYDNIMFLVQKMLDLNRKLNEATKDTDKWNKLKLEIEKMGKKIDEEVYKLYGLTPEEIKIVEKNNDLA